MPIIQRGSSHSDRNNLYSRSVLMLPDPTMATEALLSAPPTEAFTGISTPLFETQSY
ncbi:Uncharacterised protein [Mycolicibacterium fortuitum]|uniref:Uncharacterized protein n=1 Tax=Mycolicibacterium fortuitum TaxID=1766 RepID=A0A378V3U0_MYCFO|nr:Uncharacterised protein [Mycolicibacterium fortuitum]